MDTNGFNSLPPSASNALIDIETLAPGTVIAQRYRLIRQLGRDAVGIALLVEELIWNEEIVLKFLHPEVVSTNEDVMRFIEELRDARQLTHPNILQMYDFLLFGSAYALSLEYFSGHSLAEELRQGPLNVRRGVRIAWDVYRGLRRAHSLGFVHQELTPAHIQVNYTNGVKVVRHFSVVQSGHAQPEGTEALLRSPRYLAPEHLHRGVLDASANIYSLGAVMYEMFTGMPPYTATDPVTLLLQQRAGQLQPPRAIRADLPPDLETLILRAMALDPAERPQTTDDVRRHLLALSRQVPISGIF